MSEFVYIRHASKLHANGVDKSEFTFDPPITSGHQKEIDDLVDAIYNSENPPGYILCSPFKRTRETAELVRNALSTRHGYNVEIFIDRDFGEFLGNHVGKVKEEQFDPVTRSFQPIIDPNYIAFQERVEERFKTLQAENSEKPVWIITHSLVIKTIIKTWGKNIKTIPDLGALQIRDNAPWILQGDRWIKSSRSS